MPRQENGIWLPDLWGKQWDVFNSHGRVILLSGPSLSGKTHIALNKICRHLWETNGAQVAMFSKLLKNAKDGGTWKILHKRIVPEWIAGKFGFAYTTYTAEGKPGAKVDGQTRTPFFRVRNYYGGESECMLFSLDHDDDIEDKIKEQEFSMIYFSELDKFRNRKVLSISLPRLRMSHLKYEQQQWMADTNPSEDGEDSWIYKLWYQEATWDYETYLHNAKEKGIKPMTEHMFTQFQKGLELHEFKPRENPRVDPRQLEELESAYYYDAGLYARYVEGKWIYGDGDASLHFKNQFKPHHIIGNVSDRDETQWEVITPSDSISELISGWDIGDVNHAASLIEKKPIEELINGQRVFRSHFNILDELVSIGLPVSVMDFTDAVMELIEAIETHAGRQLNLDNAWSDSSSLDKYSAVGDTFPHRQVFNASGGRIQLIGVPKPKHSVKARVLLLKMLLAQDRIHVSAHCLRTIKMLKELKKGSTPLTYVVPDENKHIFDALTYALFHECADELERVVVPRMGQRIIPQQGVILQAR